MKTLAAALAQRWLVSPDWIIECGKKNEFVPEEKYCQHTRAHTITRMAL